jgi:hypothetical protein
MQRSLLPHGFAILLLASACTDGSDPSGDKGTPADDTGTPAITDADGDGVAEADDCDDTDASLGAVADDGDCDGTLTADDCDDADASSNIVAEDGDCDGVLTGEDCDDANVDLGSIWDDRDCDGALTEDDCDDTDETVYPGAPEVWEDGIDQDCDGVVDVEGSACTSEFTLTFPDGSTSTQDGCQDWEVDPSYTFGTDEAPALHSYTLTLGFTAAEGISCRFELAQSGVCGVGFYDQRDDAMATTLVLADCSDVAVPYRRTFSGAEGYLRIDTLDTGTEVGSVPGDPVPLVLAAFVHIWSEDGLDVEGDLAIAQTALAVPGVAEEDCTRTSDDVDGDGNIGQNFDGDDCDDTDGALNWDDADGDGTTGCDGDCNDHDPAVYPGASGSGRWVDADCDGLASNELTFADHMFTGESSEDRAGARVSGAGDVDGDGFADLLVGAYRSSDGASSGSGKVYLWKGSRLGVTGGGHAGTDDTGPHTHDGEHDLSDASYVFLGENGSDYAGIGLSSAGDVDGDGLGDILVGAYGNDDGGSKAGKVYVVLGASMGSEREMFLSEADHSLIGEEPNDQMGYAIDSAGDVDGDGLGDLLLGAYQNGPLVYSKEGGYHRGKAYLVLGADLASTTEMDMSEAHHGFTGEDGLDQAGFAVAGVGDVDGDGLADLLVGAYQSSSAYDGSLEGRAYVLMGAGLGSGGEWSLSDADHIFVGENDYDYAGTSLDGAGDVDGDGLADIVVGAFGNNAGGETAGAAYLLLGSSLGGESEMPLAEADHILVGADWAYDYAGRSVSSAGDVDADGHDDLLIGGSGGEGISGQSHLVLGAHLGGGVTTGLSSADASFAGENDGDQTFSIAGPGDVNGDGLSDLMFGSALNDDGGTDAGKAYLVFSWF